MIFQNDFILSLGQWDFVYPVCTLHSLLLFRGPSSLRRKLLYSPLPPSLLSLSLTYFLPGPSPRGVRGNPDVLSVLEYIGMSSVLGKYVRAFLLSLEGLFR